MLGVLDKLCDLVDLRDQGFMIVDAFGPDDPRVAFRTTVQLDGDVMSMVDPEMLASDEFEARHQAHLARVSQRLTESIVRLRRWLNGATWTGAGMVALVIGSLSSGTGMSELLVGDLELVLSSVISAAAGAIAWPLGRKVLNALLSQRLGQRSIEELRKRLPALDLGG